MSAHTATVRRRRAIDMVAGLIMGAAIRPRHVFVKREPLSFRARRMPIGSSFEVNEIGEALPGPVDRSPDGNTTRFALPPPPPPYATSPQPKRGRMRPRILPGKHRGASPQRR